MASNDNLNQLNDRFEEFKAETEAKIAEQQAEIAELKAEIAKQQAETAELKAEDELRMFESYALGRNEERKENAKLTACLRKLKDDGRDTKFAPDFAWLTQRVDRRKKETRQLRDDFYTPLREDVIKHDEIIAEMKTQMSLLLKEKENNNDANDLKAKVADLMVAFAALKTQVSLLLKEKENNDDSKVLYPDLTKPDNESPGSAPADTEISLPVRDITQKMLSMASSDGSSVGHRRNRLNSPHGRFSFDSDDDDESGRVVEAEGIEPPGHSTLPSIAEDQQLASTANTNSTLFDSDDEDDQSGRVVEPPDHSTLPSIADDQKLASTANTNSISKADASGSGVEEDAVTDNDTTGKPLASTRPEQTDRKPLPRRHRLRGPYGRSGQTGRKAKDDNNEPGENPPALSTRSRVLEEKELNGEVSSKSRKGISRRAMDMSACDVPTPYSNKTNSNSG